MLTVAYISTTAPTERPKRLTEKQKLHNMAIQSLAHRKSHDRERAKEMFAKEWEEIAQLEIKLKNLKNKNK
jgi:hypothetical protein